jgi:beta-lactamase superfamily II metal-dependent hydrolase
MLFTLETLKAKEGDCFLLHWGSVADPKLAIIDGGPGKVYETFLRPRLDEIAAKRGVSPLIAELVMVSHADSDHVNGIKKLFDDLVSDMAAGNSNIRAERLWHNIFDDIIGNALNAHFAKFTASFTASASGELKPDTVNTLTKAFKARNAGLDEGDAHEEAWDMSLILAGHGEARNLRDAHKKLNNAGLSRQLNNPFVKTLITAELTPKATNFKDLTIRIIGPMQTEIDALQAEFDAFLKDKNLATAEAALAAYADTSAKNLSSIVCTVDVGKGAAKRSMLLTGDARGDKIIEGLKKAKRLGKAAGASVHFNIFKVPHHGSDRNAELGLFTTITADYYILTGDGKHGNPERDTLEWIIDSRPKNAAFTLVFAYKIADIDAKRKAETGAKWKDATHSLAALLKTRKDAGHAFKIVEEAPIKIELGDEKVAW